MRTAISLLVTSLMLVSLAVNARTASDRLFDMLAFSDSGELVATRKARTSKPKKRTEHRGSGRRELIEYFSSTEAAV
jgi:hypothetical protein